MIKIPPISIFFFLVIITLVSCTNGQSSGTDNPDGETSPRENQTAVTATGTDGTTGTGNGAGESVSLTDMNKGLNVWLNAGCTGCHRIGDDPGGDFGPALTGVGDKYTIVDLKTLIRDPQSVNPDAGMPAQELSDEDLEYLAKYLSVLSSDTANQ